MSIRSIQKWKKKWKKKKDKLEDIKETHTETFCNRVDENSNKIILYKLKEPSEKSNLTISRTKSRDSRAGGGNDKMTE